MEQSNNQHKIIFLFGAGASVDAGVPDTYSFVSEFESYIRQSHPELHQVLLSIINLRERYNVDRNEKKQVDVEQLLDTLRRLKDRHKDPLLYFYELNKFLLESNDDAFVKLEKNLQNYIRKRVIIEDEDRLEYLKELFKFDKPLEIYSTNYDTCVEQLCYINHRVYTDGFDINWNEKNFGNNNDVNHYKLHGSVIWYQNQKTKECIKIPVDAFREEEPLDLRLIYGEGVKPLLIYPAQKAEYVEPLTDLQLMFKHRLFKGTKFVIAVGYSFRDDYIVHMLWDAARANDDLTLIIINPNAQALFENKLRYTDKSKKSESRINDRTVCLPYPFSPIIYQFKNNYLSSIEYVSTLEKQYLDSESKGNLSIPWAYLLWNCIEAEFVSKAEWVLQEKIGKNWNELAFDQPQKRLTYSFKALLHSAICKDEYQERWLLRVNEALKMFGISNLHMSGFGNPTIFRFMGEDFNYEISRVLNDWIAPIVADKKRIFQLLTSKFESSLSTLAGSFSRLDEFWKYLKEVEKGVNPQNYKINADDSSEIQIAKKLLKPRDDFLHFTASELENTILLIEKDRLKKIFGGDSLEFRLE